MNLRACCPIVKTLFLVILRKKRLYNSRIILIAGSFLNIVNLAFKCNLHTISVAHLIIVNLSYVVRKELDNPINPHNYVTKKVKNCYFGIK